MEERFSGLLFRTGLVGCLLGAAATLYFLFGLSGYVHSLLLNLSVGIALAISSLFFLCHFLTVPRQTNRFGRAIWFAIVAIIVAEALLSLVPPTARDELTHHLAIPRLYARAGRIIEVPIAPYSYYPMLLDMLYMPWVHWGYDSIPKLVHALFGYLTGLSLYAYLSRRMNAVYGLLGFFFFISTPAVLRLSHWAYIDLGITFYSTTALLCLLRWREERDALGWLALAALSLGFALATKPNGLVAGLILALLFALILVKPPRKSFGGIGCELFLFGALTLLPFAPWLIKNWLQTGNPFFPLLAGYFPGSGGAGGEVAISFGSLAIFTKRELLYGESWWQIAALPLRVFFSGQDDNPQLFDGVLTPILILLLPWTFQGKWAEEKRLLISFALLFFAYALFLVDLRIRYILLIVPALVILLVYGIFNVYLRTKRPGYLFAGLLLFAALHGFYLRGYVQEIRPMDYLAGRESREAYLTRMLPEYPVFHYINRELPPGAKIYLLFIGRRGYYCEQDYFHDGGELPGLLLSAIQSAREPAQIARTLQSKSITHLMVRDELLVRFLSDNLNSAQGTLWKAFVTHGLQPRFQARGFSLYQLHG